MKLGATEKDLVPFKDYCKAANNLTAPSSAIRALSNGAKHIERFDILMRLIAAQQGMNFRCIEEITNLINNAIEKNRQH
jgi:hypothetical protein